MVGKLHYSRMPFVADELGAWLVGLLADAGRNKLTVLVLGTKQERAIRGAASTAVEMMAQELRPEGGERAEQLAMVVDQVFSDPMPDASLGEHATMLELLQARVARKLAWTIQA